MTTNSSGASQISGRTLLIVAPITACLMWSGILIFTRFVPPATILSRVTVLFLIGIALISTSTPLIYLIRKAFPKERLATFAINHAIREATLISLCVVFNLVLRLLQSWSIFTTLASFGIIVVVEVLALGQK